MSENIDIEFETLDHNAALEYVKRFQVLLEINANINSTMDLEMLLRTIIDVAATAMNSEASSLALREAETGELVFHLASGEGGKTVESVRLKKGEGIAGWVAENSEPLIVPDVSKDERFFKGVDEKSEFVTRSIMCVPMTRSGDKTIGVLQVLNKRVGTFDDQDMVLFRSLANIAAIAIENSQLYHILQQTLDKLREDNARLNMILGQLEQSQEEVKKLKADVQEGSDGAIRGSLATVIPPNLLQMLANDMKTGTISLKSSAGQGKICLRNGEVFHAELLQEPRLMGMDAIYEMINWNEGNFAFVDFKDSEYKEETTMQASVMHLIIEGLRRGDELKVLLEKYPPEKHLNIFEHEVPEEAMAAARLILPNAIQGGSLDEMWKRSKMDRHSFYSNIETLVTSRLLELKDPE